MGVKERSLSDKQPDYNFREISFQRSAEVWMSEGQRFRIEVANNLDALAPASAQAEGWLETNEASPKQTYLAILAIEELVTNCIKYGYDDSNEHMIGIELGLADGTLTMSVTDDGHAFNPLDAATPDFGIAVERREIGGLGIHMLRKLSDDVQYERRDETNRITLTKRPA